MNVIHNYFPFHWIPQYLNIISNYSKRCHLFRLQSVFLTSRYWSSVNDFWWIRSVIRISFIILLTYSYYSLGDFSILLKLYICYNFQLSSTAKVERWFELLEPMSLSRPESGFVSYQDNEREQDEDERAILEGTRSLLMKLSARKQRKLLSLKLGKVTTFWEKILGRNRNYKGILHSFLDEFRNYCKLWIRH